MEQGNKKLEFVHRLREQMHDLQIMFSYRGNLSHEVMLALLAMTDKKLEMEGSEKSLRAKVFNVVVECMQNLTMQYDVRSTQMAPLFMIGKEEKGYLVFSGNTVNAENVRTLKNNLLKINTMTKDELKEFHKVWLQSVRFSNASDAGLGLIDIARKTGNKLDFDFEPLDDGNYYFSLCTAISEGREQRSGEVIKIKDLHGIMQDNDVSLMYDGEFSQEFTKSMLAFMERKFISDELEDSLRRKIFNIMVEILQNLSKHNYQGEKTGKDVSSAFMIGYGEEDYFIISGNPILQTGVEALRAKIDQVNELDKDGLKQLYKEVRLQGKFSEVSGAGIGLIDIARKSGQALEYDFSSLDEELSFFIMLSRISKNSTNTNN
ncbi:MAG: SiaB family protein kinase [Bacteroidales bacterium]